MAEAGTSREIVEVQLAAVGRRVLVFLRMWENNAINHPLGNGFYIPPIKMVIWEMVYFCFTHMIL